MKTVKSVQHYLEPAQLTTVVAVDKVHTTVLTFEDDTKKYIFIALGMIFVCDFDLEELTRRILADVCDTFEAYDTSDGCSYYFNSDYAEYISDALLNLANIQLR